MRLFVRTEWLLYLHASLLAASNGICYLSILIILSLLQAEKDAFEEAEKIRIILLF